MKSLAKVFNQGGGIGSESSQGYFEVREEVNLEVR
jgi:hypothetical protein